MKLSNNRKKVVYGGSLRLEVGNSGLDLLKDTIVDDLIGLGYKVSVDPIWGPYDKPLEDCVRLIIDWE